MTTRRLHAILVGLTILVATLTPLPANAGALTPCYWPHRKAYVWVYIVSAPYWDVPRAMRVWNGINRGQPKYRRTWSRTRADVVVNTYRQYGTTTNGTTQYSCTPGVSMAATVRLNAARRLTRAQRQEVSVHELGHALGLGHRYSGRSVMRGWLPNATSLPTWLDRQALGRRY